MRIRNTGNNVFVIFALYLIRCAVAVKKEWTSVEDSMLFLTTDYDDDQDTKMALVKTIAGLDLCNLCKPPKELPLVMFYSWLLIAA